MFIIIGVLKPNVTNPLEEYGYNGIWFPPAVVPDDVSGEYRPSKMYSYNSYNLADRACKIMNERRINRTGVNMSEEDFYGYVVWNTEEPLADLIPFNVLGEEIFDTSKCKKYPSQPLCACEISSKMYNTSIDANIVGSDNLLAYRYDYRIQREGGFS